MGEVITFQKPGDSDDVVAALRATLDHLASAADTLQDDLVGIAMAGVWRTWSDQQPVGTLLYVTGEMMTQTGDARIDRLCEPLRAMRLALADLASYRSGRPEAAPEDHPLP